MATTLKVKLLSSKEWASIAKRDPRYEHVDEDNAGFADREKGVVYVRDTKFADLNKYLIEHELEHLFEDKATHEDEHGIRHKKFFKDVVAQPLARFVGRQVSKVVIPTDPTTNPVGSAIAQAVGEAGGQAVLSAAQGEQAVGRSAAGAGISSFASDIGSRLPIPGGDLLGRTAGNVLENKINKQPTNIGALAANAGVNAALNYASNKLFTNSGRSGTPLQGGMTPAPVATNAPAPTPQSSGPSKLVTGIKSGISRLFGGGGATATQQQPPPGGTNFNLSQYPQLGGPTAPLPTTSLPTASSQTTGQNQGGFNNLLKNLFPGGAPAALASAALLGIGQTRQSPEVPDFSNIDSINQIRENAGKPLSGPGIAAQTQLVKNINQPFPAELEQSIQHTFDQERQNITSQFKLLRPNADLATDSGYRRAMQEVDQRQADSMAQATQQFKQQQIQSIQQGLGVDEQTLNTLGVLAQLDVDELRARFNLDIKDAQDFKDTFGKLGGMLFSKAIGLNQFQPTAGVP